MIKAYSISTNLKYDILNASLAGINLDEFSMASYYLFVTAALVKYIKDGIVV